MGLVHFTQKAGLQGLRGAWPWPSAEAWTILAVFGALQAALQLGLPGAEHRGPVSPKGNVPVYKALLFTTKSFYPCMQ
jgi:7-dehydrocholesterol reductase